MEKRKIFGILFVVCIIGGICAFLIPKHTTDVDEDDTKSSLDFLPKRCGGENPKSALIWTNRQNEVNQSKCADDIHSFIQKYRNNSIGNPQRCRFGNGKGAGEDAYCVVEIDKMHGCVSTRDKYGQDKYGYISGVSRPCTLIKFNKMNGWIPETYKTEVDLAEADRRKMPKVLQERIRLLINTTNELTKQELNTVWISCDGENPVDRENIGEVRFYAPGFDEDFPGIPGYFFPYLKQDGYQDPFVMLQFENPKVNTLIRVECKAWARNLDTEKKHSPSSLRFELLLD